MQQHGDSQIAERVRPVKGPLPEQPPVLKDIVNVGIHHDQRIAVLPAELPGTFHLVDIELLLGLGPAAHNGIPTVVGACLKIGKRIDAVVRQFKIRAVLIHGSEGVDASGHTGGYYISAKDRVRQWGSDTDAGQGVAAVV